MPLVAVDLANKIMDAQMNTNKKCLDDDIPSKSDEDLAKEGKVRVDLNGVTKIMSPDKIKNFDYLEVMGEEIVKYIKENTDFIYKTDIFWTVPSGTGTAIVKDPLQQIFQIKISSIQNKLKGYVKSVPEFVSKIEDSISTAQIDLQNAVTMVPPVPPLLPPPIYVASQKDKFGPVKIIYNPKGTWEVNMMNLATAIVTAVKAAISTSPVSVQNTLPPAISSTGTAKMITIL